ncbi:hypothetical protein N2152v2_005554 [Parachlorella kessleri]
MASQVESIKRVPGTPFIVDGFRFQSAECRHYFLTHAHSDHTTGLGRSFSGGTIYCTPVTAAILQLDFGLKPGIVQPLPMDETVTIAGVEVTPVDANHCPGACMFLFKVPPGLAAPPQEGAAGEAAGGWGRSSRRAGEAQVFLHTGDMRWHPRLALHPALQANPVHTLILDTTYCAPKWVFPPQEEAVGLIVDLMKREVAAHPDTLFVVGSYHIGKERAYLGAAHQLGWGVYCQPAKRKVGPRLWMVMRYLVGLQSIAMRAAERERAWALLRVLGLPREWLALLVDEPQQGPIHILGMGEQLHEQALADRIRGSRWERVVAIRPTGCVTIVGVPYSEHSSFEELRDCVRTLKPKKIVPTVNAADTSKSRALVDLLADCMDLSRDRTRLDSYFRRVVYRGASAVASALGRHSVLSRQEEAVSMEGSAGTLLPATPEGKQPQAIVLGLSSDACPAQSTVHGSALETAAAAGAAPVEGSSAAGAADVSHVAAVAGVQHGRCLRDGKQREGQQQQGPGHAGSCLAASQPPQEQQCCLRRSGSGLGSGSSWDLKIDLGGEEMPWKPASLQCGYGTAAVLPENLQAGLPQRDWVPPPAVPQSEPHCSADVAAGRKPVDVGQKQQQARSSSSSSLAAAAEGAGAAAGARPANLRPDSEGQGAGQEEVVDLTAVDLDEQQRILDTIAKARASGAAAGRGKRRSTAAGTASATKLKQGSLKHFFYMPQD